MLKYFYIKSSILPPLLTINFISENVRVIVEKVAPSLTPQDQRGNPLTVPQIVCLSLEQMAGGHFQRTQV